MPRAAAKRRNDPAAGEVAGEHPFAIETVPFGAQTLRVGRTAPRGGVPLLMFNGIGGNIELLAPIAQALSSREIITFDVPGVGGSSMPAAPYRMRDVARLAAEVLDHAGHAEADVLGVSWGGAAAQQFAHSFGSRCRRLVLCATSPGAVMVPARPSVLLKMATPRRYMNREYGRAIAGDIYGGDFRTDQELAAQVYRNVRWKSRWGYYLQLAAATGWTSIHWLHGLPQPTLIMAGIDDPLVPLANARLMHWLIPHSELLTFDCGHLFLLTRSSASATAINRFLDKP